MDQQIQKLNRPDYQRIYTDIIKKRFPEKMKECQFFLEKETLSVLEIIKINRILFGDSSKENKLETKRHRSYDVSSIFQILKFQKNMKLNNQELANHFGMSRNTVTSWRKKFETEI